jgi:hypothetical protein
VSIPYSWNLLDAADDQIGLNFNVEGKLAGNLSTTGLATVKVPNLTVQNIATLFNDSAFGHLVDRKSTQSGLTINVPANGATTTQNLDFTF